MRLAELASARVAIWGYGREGRASLRAIRKRFADKNITVFCNDDEAKSIRADASLAPVDAVTQPVDEDTLRRFDVVVKSPGISPYKSPYVEAEKAGVRFTSASAMWFSERPDAKTICVTGTKGKSTLTALIAHLLRGVGRCVALAGNIGMPVLDLLDAEREPDWWVIELSSFQTRDFDGAPTIAVVNNVYEEHLDWHGTPQRYVDDKLMIVAKAKCVIVPTDLAADVPSRTEPIEFGNAAGWHVRDGAIFRGALRVFDLARWTLPGLHNAQNLCAALATIEAAGEDAMAAVAHATSFKALPHRLQPLGEHDGVRWINDSISTTPYASVEALRSVAPPATILVGGFDRGVSWSIFVEYVAKYLPHAVITMGANGSAIAGELRMTKGFALRESNSLAEAVALARSMTPAGGAIVLSPGAPSFDQFRDYAERGREFARLAGFDPAVISQIEGLGIA